MLAWLTLDGGAEVCKGGRGPGGGYHVGQLLPALLLPGSMGWQQGVRFCVLSDSTSFTACIILLGKVYLRSHLSRELVSFSMRVIHAVIACFATLRASQL